MKRIFIFIFYLLTQPFIELWGLFKFIFAKDAPMSYPRTWQYIFLILTIGSYLAKNRVWTNVFGVLLVATIIKAEWDRGFFMERYRKRIEKKAEDMIKKEEETKKQEKVGDQQ